MFEINLSNIQLQDLELFLAVADYGNFTKAGEKHYVTQSWVSKRMNFLEHELGLQLFLRSRNKMSLTPAGQYLAERLHEAETFLIDSIKEANEIQTGVSGSVKIGVLEWASNVLLLPLREFIRNQPQLSVDVFYQQFQDFRIGLNQGKLDLVFTMEYDNKSFLETNISSTRLFPAQVMAYMSVENPLAKKKLLHVKDLQSQNMLMLHDYSSSGYNEFVRQIFQTEKIRPIISHYASSGRAHIANLIFDRGVLIASNYFLKNEFDGQIVGVPIDGVETYITAIWKKDNTNPVIPRLLSEITGGGTNQRPAGK